MPHLCLCGGILAARSLPPHLLATYVGENSIYAIPLAVLVGAPMYLDGYAALPLVRGLLDLGMSPGAAMAFLVSGGAVSIWGVMAVVAVLRPADHCSFRHACRDRFAGDRITVGGFGVAVMKRSRIGNGFAALWRTLCTRRGLQGIDRYPGSTIICLMISG